MGEGILVWLSCLGDTPALSCSLTPSTPSLPGQVLEDLALGISCRLLMLLVMCYTH